MHLRMLSFLSLLLLISCDRACTDDGLLIEDFEWEGEHVTVRGYGYTEADVCAGSLEALDDRIALLEGFLGIDSTPHFEFGWIALDIWHEDTSCAKLTGCADGHKAWSTRLPHMHEATHMITHSFECPPILNEGLADYFDDPDFSRQSPPEGLSVEDLIEDDRILGGVGAYARATHFTSSLLEAYGPEAVLELCRAIPRDDTIADWQAAVPEVLGLSFEDVLWVYEIAYPACTSHQLRGRLWGCAGTPDFVLSSEDPQRSEYRFQTDCDDSRTTNAASPVHGGAATSRLIYVVGDDWLTIEARAEGPSGTPARFTLQECVSCYHEPVAVRSGDPGWLNIENAYEVRAGFYEVTLFFDRHDRAELSITAGFPY
jgi:hypothetical protein